MLVYKI